MGVREPLEEVRGRLRWLAIVCNRFTSHRKQQQTVLLPSLHFQEVFQQPLTILSQDGLRVELDSVDRQFLVAQAHDLGLVIITDGGDL